MVEQLKKQLKSPDSLVSLFLGIAVVVVTGVLIFNYIKGKQTGKPTTLQKEEQVAKPKLPTTHTVASGETLWTIAEKYYESGYNWVDIATASTLVNPDVIEAGQQLTIPDVPKRLPEGQISAAAFEVKKPPEGKYTVKRGDTLWDISLSIYGTGFRWVEIAKANKLANPDLIHAGNVFILP